MTAHGGVAPRDSGGPEAAVVVATRSEGKMRELRALFGAAGITIADLRDVGLGVEAPEEAALERFETFEENAMAKARHFAARLPGRLVAADDSGLVVDALGGAPGVRSKRWSGSTASGAALDEANNAAVLRALAGRTGPGRSARYVTVLACVDGRGGVAREVVVRGECAGRILAAREGTAGFGYDPLFFSDDLQRTFGQATREEKDAVSHRGHAVRALAAALRAAGAWGAS